MCCLVCVCFVQAVCSVAKEREDVEMRDPGALSTSCGDGTGLGCPRTAIFQFTCGDVPGRRSRAGRMRKKKEKKANNCKHIPLVSEEEYAFTNETSMDLGGVREVKGKQEPVVSFEAKYSSVVNS